MKFWLFVFALVGWLVAYAAWTVKDYDHTVVPCVNPLRDLGWDNARIRAYALALNPNACFDYKLSLAWEFTGEQ